MVIDTSAILAILFHEPERRLFNEAIEAAESRLLFGRYLDAAAYCLDSDWATRAIRA